MRKYLLALFAEAKGYPCGKRFIPRGFKCWTDPKSGARLKKPLTYQVYKKIQASTGNSAQKYYKDRAEDIKKNAFGGQRIPKTANVDKPKKEIWEMSASELDKTLKSVDANQYAGNITEDWGSGRGQGKRVGGMVMGGMSSAARGKKTYTDPLQKLQETAENKKEAMQLSLTGEIDLDKYIKIRGIGQNHDVGVLLSVTDYGKKQWRVTDKQVRDSAADLAKIQKPNGENVQPKKEVVLQKKIIKPEDAKSASDREAYTKQELNEAKASGDKQRIAAWEKEAKRARMANLKTSQQKQKQTQQSLFDPMAYDSDSPLLRELYKGNEPTPELATNQQIKLEKVKSRNERKTKAERVSSAQSRLARQSKLVNDKQANLRGRIAQLKKSGDLDAVKELSLQLQPLKQRESQLQRRFNKIKKIDSNYSISRKNINFVDGLHITNTSLKSRADFAGGWQCGDTFIPRNRRCYTDPKSGAKLKIPLTYKEYTARRAQVYKAAQQGQLPDNEGDRKLLQSVTNRQAKLASQKEKLQLSQAAAAAGAKQVLPSGIAEVNVSNLKVDPKRFQYKIIGAATQSGSVGSLSGIKKWDPNLAGIIQVWQDPKDKQVYVVNGHNRKELAQKLGVEKITARFLKAKTPEEARAIAALTNIAEGRGNTQDAAKFFRDTGLSKEDLDRKGIPMREKIATDGIALSRLSEPLFNRVVQGSLPEQRAVVIGASLKDQKQQQELVNLIEKEEKRGRKINNDTIQELADMVTGTPKVKKQQGGLFDLLGFTPESRSLAVEKAQLQAGIKKQLSREKKLFGTVGKSRAADELAKAGNKINVEESAEISESASKALEAFDKEKSLSGGVSSALNKGAERIANGENQKKVEKEIYDEILANLQKTYRFGKGSGVDRTKRKYEGDERMAASKSGQDIAEFARPLKRRLKRRIKYCCK